MVAVCDIGSLALDTLKAVGVEVDRFSAEVIFQIVDIAASRGSLWIPCADVAFLTIAGKPVAIVTVPVAVVVEAVADVDFFLLARAAGV